MNKSEALAAAGRTGTLSLKLALERLGFGPCYHTRELLKKLDAHVAARNLAAEGVVVDWDALYETIQVRGRLSHGGLLS